MELILLIVLLVSAPPSVSQAIESKIYWTDAGTDKIQCANLDGSNVQDLIYIKDVRSPTSIALDVDGGKMYWIQTFLFSSEIWRANLNGSRQQRIVRTSLDSINDIALDAASDIALDATDDRMYWVEQWADRIRRANLNGFNVQTLVSGLSRPLGIALSISAAEEFIEIVDFVPKDTSGWSLPEGAKARLGKGSINEIAYSPDGTLLAVASSIGIWIYDIGMAETQSVNLSRAGCISIRSPQVISPLHAKC